jgi:hypothetical protein
MKTDGHLGRCFLKDRARPPSPTPIGLPGAIIPYFFDVCYKT